RKSRAFAAQAAEAANLLWDAQRPVKVDLKTYRWAVASPVLQASAVVVLGAAADLATKAWAQSRLAGGHDITLGGGLLRLQLVVSHGAAFGLAARLEPVLAIVSVLIVVALWVWAARARSRLERVGAALAAAGGGGNLLDRPGRAPPGLPGGGVGGRLH